MQPLRPIAPNIWTADGPPVNALGPVVLPTRTVVVRLRNGTLWINSPVAAERSAMESVAELGEVAHLVAPTKLHLWRLPAWGAAFPKAQLWGPPGAREKGVALTGTLGDAPPAVWSGDLDQIVFRGNLFLEEVEFYHSASRTLIFTDFIQNYPPLEGRPVRNAVLRAAGVLGGGVPRDVRLTFFKRAEGRESLDKLLAWEFDRLVPAHGAVVERNAHLLVEDAFRWLGRS
jgi:Domain of unknown function (DUF4336)